MKIIPSIASAPQLDLRYQLDRIAEIPYVHIDVEDGNFLPNITFGMKTVREIAAHSKAELDVHLLVTNPMAYVRELIRRNLSAVCAHLEALPYPLEFLQPVRQAGMRAGLAMNPAMPVSAVRSYIGSFDYLLLMTSEPDGAGQVFRETALERIREARSCLPPDVEIWADGGIDRGKLKPIGKAGADRAVMGRAVWAEKCPVRAWKEMEEMDGQD